MKVKKETATWIAPTNEVEAFDCAWYILERYKYLYSLKRHRFQKYWKYRNRYAQVNQVDNTEDGFIDYSMNTWLALVDTKTAEIHANTPQYDFVWLDENWRRYKKLVEKLWDWVWIDSGTDRALTQIVRDACKYWSWFWMETYSKRYRNVKVPDVSSDWLMTFNLQKVKEYEGCELIPLDWSAVFLNWNSIDNSTEWVYVSHWDKDEFFEKFPTDKFQYSKSSIVPWKRYHTPPWMNEFISWWTDRKNDDTDNANTISVIEYWNKYKDIYGIMANDVHINPIDKEFMPIPFPHKEIPIVQYVDHQIDWDIYWMGEYEISEKSCNLKDASRSLMIESIKMQGGIITIDPNSDFDETIERIGLKQFARVAKEDLNFFQPNINISPLELLEKKIDEDIIVETWVDFRSQLLGPNETAARTKGRTESARKRINSNIRENAYTFYSRLAKLRISNIKMFYKGKEDTIPVKGFSITEDWVQESLAWDYGIMKITSNMLTWDILLVPIVDSITWDTSKIQKQKYMEFLQIALNMKKPDGSPLFDPAQLIDAWRWIIDDVVDLDKLLWSNIWVENEINKRLKERWLPTMEDPSETPWGVPPAQQSWRAVVLPSQAAEPQE